MHMENILNYNFLPNTNSFCSSVGGALLSGSLYLRMIKDTCFFLICQELRAYAMFHLIFLSKNLPPSHSSFLKKRLSFVMCVYVVTRILVLAEFIMWDRQRTDLFRKDKRLKCRKKLYQVRIAGSFLGLVGKQEVGVWGVGNDSCPDVCPWEGLSF